jgi:hypothetical protein
MFRAMFSPVIRSTWLYLQYLVVFTQVSAGWCLGWVETELYGLWGVYALRHPESWRSWIRASWYNCVNNQQDALYRLIYYSKSADVSCDVFARHQEHLTVFTVSGSIHQSCCRLVFWMSWNWTMWIVRRVFFLTPWIITLMNPCILIQLCN